MASGLVFFRRLRAPLHFTPGWVFTLALALRLIFVLQWHNTPYGATPLWDAQSYHDWAQDIAQGHLLRDRAFYSFPLFPYLLGALYAVFGHSLWIASLLNAVVGAATCALLADLSEKIFGPLAGKTTGLLAALYLPLIFYTAPVLKEPLGLFLMSLALVFSWRAITFHKNFLWAGFFLGLSALVRGNVLALALIVPGVLIFRHRAALLKQCALYLLGIALALLPVTAHNAYVSHDFVLLSYAGGFNSYIGHGPMATGTSYEFPPNIVDEEYDTTRIASAALGHPAKPSEVSSYWHKQAFDYAAAHPAREWNMLADKFMAFWSDAEPFDNYDMRFIAGNFPTILTLPLPGFGLVAILAAFGIAGCPRRHRRAALVLGSATALYMLTMIPFYVTDRYRLPVVVFLLPLAGLGITMAKELLDQKNKRRAVIAITAALTAALIAFWPQQQNAVNAAYDWGVLSTLYADQGQLAQSLAAFDESIMLDEHQAGPDVWIRHADVKDRLGQKDEARQTLQQAAILFPSDGSITYNLGRMKYRDGDYAAAQSDFEQAIRQTPTFLLSYRGLALVYAHNGDRVRATEIVKQGLQINPSDRGLKALLEQTTP